MNYKKLIIIIPAFNEEKTISDVIKRIPVIHNLKQEIIVIDDGSTDTTALRAKKAGAHVISNKTNQGLGFCLKEGLIAALKNRADIIVNIDADGQYDPGRIPDLINPILMENVDLVIGNRFLGEIKYKMNIIKKWGNKIISIFISKVLLRLEEIYDIQSGYRSINKNLAKILVKVLTSNYTYTQEMIILSSLLGFKMKQISIDFFQRTSGKSRLIKNPFKYLFKVLWVSVRTYCINKYK